MKKFIAIAMLTTFALTGLALADDNGDKPCTYASHEYSQGATITVDHDSKLWCDPDGNWVPTE